MFINLIALISFLIWIKLVFFHGKFWQKGPILEAPSPAEMRKRDSWPDVVVVVPARDEAPSIEACIMSLLDQDYSGVCRIVLVDDGSTDGTGNIVRHIQKTHPKGDLLTVLRNSSRPEGWSGKLWAVSSGIQMAKQVSHAEDGYFLLTDADIIHKPAHLSSLVQKALSDKLDMVSEMVELHCESLAEKILVPAFVFFFAMLYPFASINNPKNRVAGAAGGTILVRRSKLGQIGGIEALKGALIDDVTLAAYIKQAGGRLYLGHSQQALSIRPYPYPADIWNMVARTAYVQLKYSPWQLLGTVIGMFLVWLAPMLLIFFAHGWAQTFGVMAWGMSVASYMPTLNRFKLSYGWVLLLPFIAIFYTAATIGSAYNHYRGRGVVWKNRAYIETEGHAPPAYRSFYDAAREELSK